jgi:hypothetical protein
MQYSEAPPNLPKGEALGNGKYKLHKYWECNINIIPKALSLGEGLGEA